MRKRGIAAGDAVEDASSATPKTKGRRRLWKVLLYGLYCVGTSYVLLEATYSTLVSRGFRAPKLSAYLVEETGRTVRFDPVRGFRLTSTPSRQARITHGVVEYVGVLRGNNQGFPDRDDFGPKRDDPVALPKEGHTNPESLRIAVFGDSFTAAQFLDVNWPDRVEDMAREAGFPLRLFNFSLDGGGLANWAHIVVHLLEKEAYELDALVFAVADDDLERTFIIADHLNYDCHQFGYLQTWCFEDFPKTIEEARPLLNQSRGYFVSPEQFDAALEGRWRPDYPEPWRPHVALAMLFGLARLLGLIETPSWAPYDPGPPLPEIFDPGRADAIEAIGRFAESRGLPILVVRVPVQRAVFQGERVEKDMVEVHEFASRLHAAFIDGLPVFDSLDERAKTDLWLPYDGHWAQPGSDVFAAFMADVLRTWITREAPRAQAMVPQVPAP